MKNGFNEGGWTFDLDGLIGLIVGHDDDEGDDVEEDLLQIVENERLFVMDIRGLKWYVHLSDWVRTI